MASGGTRAAAAALHFCFFFFSGVVSVLLVLLQEPRLPGLVIAARDRFLDGRGGLLELATRRNMILLCHAILLLILRDAGVLGAPAARRRSPPYEDATDTAAVVVAQTDAPAPTAAVVAQTASSAVVLVHARPQAARTAVVWRRRPRNRAAAAAPTHEHVAAAAASRLFECHPAAEVAATWATPVLTTGPPAQATKEIVLAELPRNDDDLLDRHDRALVVQQLERPTAIAVNIEKDCCDDRRIIAVDDEKSMNDTPQQTAGMEMEMELADDRTFEEFIKSQRRQMRQESLQLDRSGSGYHYQPMIAACY